MVRAATGPEATDDAIVLALVEKVSPRQRDVLQLTAKGLTNQEIGLVLGMSPETVRTHLSAIFARLHVSNRAEAAAAYAAWDASTKPWMGTPPHGRADASSTRVAEILSRPAIAILPMIALDHDPHTLPAAAGLSRDLVVLFSRWCWFPVIAHSSTRDVRALGDTNQEIGARLGARFLIDGSLRASSTTYRLNICVTDTLTGSVVWAQNFDFARYDLFVAQDQVCQAVVAAVYPCLVASVKETLPPFPHAADVDAWEVAHHAFTLHDRRDRESNQKAQAGFSIAIHRDPTLVLGHFGLGLSAFDIILNQWGPIGPEVDRLAGCADRCIELAPHMAEGYYLQARAQQSRGDPDRSIDLLEQAIGHNPSFALAHVLLAQVLLFSGRLEEGVVRMKQACRLGPRSFVTGMAVAHFVRRDFALALYESERAIESNPRYPFARAVAAASAFWLKDHGKARAHADTLAAMQPAFDAGALLRTFGANVDAVASMATALKAIGER